MLMTILSLVLEPNTYSILIKNDETNTLSSTGINKQDSSPWSGTTTLDQNLGSSLELIYGDFKNICINLLKHYLH